MQSTGVSIQVDRRLGNICLEGDPVLVDKVSRVINRLAADTASSSVGCGGKKVMTAIRRLISDCAAYHSNNNNFSNKTSNRGELRKTPSNGERKSNPDGGMNSTQVAEAQYRYLNEYVPKFVNVAQFPSTHLGL